MSFSYHVPDALLTLLSISLSGEMKCGDAVILVRRGQRDLENDVRLDNGAGAGYGLGVDVGIQNGRFMVEHSGEVSGFTAENIVFPQRQRRGRGAKPTAATQ